MQRLLTSFDTLKDAFADNELAMDIIERETEAAQEWIIENTPEDPERSPRTLGSVETSAPPQGARSIFDDIDDEH